jgi:hypothetical protein
LALLKVVAINETILAKNIRKTKHCIKHLLLPAPLIPNRPKQCPHGIEKQRLLTA